MPLPTTAEPNRPYMVMGWFLNLLAIKANRTLTVGGNLKMESTPEGGDIIIGNSPDSAIRMRVKSIANDYLTCHTWDGTNEGTVDILVAKPAELRHVLATYAQLTGFTTVGTQTATATDGVDTETWKVTPDYVVDGEIWATLCGSGTGVTVSGAELGWIDLNLSGRAWAVEA